MDAQQEIMETIRQRYDLEENDTSMDNEINALSPIEKLREMSAWHLGDKGWADQFVAWAAACGVEIKP